MAALAAEPGEDAHQNRDGAVRTRTASSASYEIRCTPPIRARPSCRAVSAARLHGREDDPRTSIIAAGTGRRFWLRGRLAWYCTGIAMLPRGAAPAPRLGQHAVRVGQHLRRRNTVRPHAGLRPADGLDLRATARLLDDPLVWSRPPPASRVQQRDRTAWPSADLARGSYGSANSAREFSATSPVRAADADARLPRRVSRARSRCHLTRGAPASTAFLLARPS
jgi:hypothetical protein